MAYRHSGLLTRFMEGVENKLVRALIPEVIVDHIFCAKAALERYHIADPGRLINLDKTGISFRMLSGKGIRKGTGKA